MESYLEFCKTSNNSSKEGLARVELTACHESYVESTEKEAEKLTTRDRNGHPELAIEQLSLFIAASTKVEGETTPQMKFALSQASHQLGVLNNKLRNYDVAVEHLERYYHLTAELSKNRNCGSSDLDLNSARVQLGIAKANMSLKSHFTWIAEAGKPGKSRGLENLLLWKSKREIAPGVQ